MSEIIDESKKIAGIMDLDLYMSDEELLRMDQEHYYQKGIEEGIQKGIEEGIAKTKKEMIRNLYNNSVSIELIADSSNLSVDEVKKIIEECE